MIRDAQFIDVPGIVGLLTDQYRRTHYAKDGTADIDTAEAKRLLVTAIQRHGHRHGGGCWVQVSETGGVITGLILGNLQRVYAIGNRLCASDLFWVVSAGADPMDAIRLMNGMIEWARSCPDCIEIKCGVTGIISDDPDRTGLILERLGMEPYGRFFRMET